jgi:hypothetical protein
LYYKIFTSSHRDEFVGRVGNLRADCESARRLCRLFAKGWAHPVCGFAAMRGTVESYTE